MILRFHQNKKSFIRQPVIDLDFLCSAYPPRVSACERQTQSTQQAASRYVPNLQPQTQNLWKLSPPFDQTQQQRSSRQNQPVTIFTLWPAKVNIHHKVRYACLVPHKPKLALNFFFAPLVIPPSIHKLFDRNLNSSGLTTIDANYLASLESILTNRFHLTHFDLPRAGVPALGLLHSRTHNFHRSRSGFAAGISKIVALQPRQSTHDHQFLHRYISTLVVALNGLAQVTPALPALPITRSFNTGLNLFDNGQVASTTFFLR